MAAMGAGLGWCLLSPVRLFGAALRADRELGLKERLSSALAIGEPGTEPERAVLRDAAEQWRRLQHDRILHELRDRARRRRLATASEQNPDSDPDC